MRAISFPNFLSPTTIVVQKSVKRSQCCVVFGGGPKLYDLRRGMLFVRPYHGLFRNSLVNIVNFVVYFMF